MEPLKISKPLGIDMKIKEFWAMKKDEYKELTEDKTGKIRLKKSDIPGLASREFIWWYAARYMGADDYRDKMAWVCSYDGIRLVNNTYAKLLNPAPASIADIASEKQINYIESLANKAGIKFDKSAVISKEDASKAITYLKTLIYSKKKLPLPNLSFLSRS